MTRFCTKCGSKLSDEARFCTSCGAERRQSASGDAKPAVKEHDGVSAVQESSPLADEIADASASEEARQITSVEQASPSACPLGSMLRREPTA